jgi:hypothetical protein
MSYIFGVEITCITLRHEACATEMRGDCHAAAKQKVVVEFWSKAECETMLHTPMGTSVSATTAAPNVDRLALATSRLRKRVLRTGPTTSLLAKQHGRY